MILPAVVISTATAQWTRCSGPTGGVIHELAVSPADSSTMMAASLAGLLKSSDAGSTWTLLERTLADTGFTSCTALIFAGNEGNRLFVGTLRSGLFESTDGGQNWTACSQFPNGFRIRQLAIYPQNPQRLIAGTCGGGLFLSADGGKSWRRSPGEWRYQEISAILPLSGQEYPFLVGVWGKGLYRGHWAMETWERVATDLPLAYVTVLRWIRPGQILTAGTYGHGLFRASDGGWSFMPVEERLVHREVTDLLADPWRPETLYLSTDGGGVFRSLDQGLSWTCLDDGLGYKHVYSLAISHDWLYAGTCWGGIYRRPR